MVNNSLSGLRCLIQFLFVPCLNNSVSSYSAMSCALNPPLVYFVQMLEEQNDISFYSAIALDILNILDTATYFQNMTCQNY